MILPLGEPVQIADLYLIYQGLADTGGLRVNVVIPSLDRSYAYPNELRSAETGNVVTLVGHRFEIMGATNAVLRLKHLSQ